MTDELPDCNDFDVIQFKARQMIVDQVVIQIRQWCLDHHVEDTFYQIFDLFIKECKLIKSNFSEINRIIQGVQSPNDDGTFQQRTETASDVISTDDESSLFTTEEKLLIVATAPLWLPILIGATIVTIPIALGSIIKDAIMDKMKIKQYRKNKMKHMLTLAEQKINVFNANMLYDSISLAYLHKFMSSLEEVCKKIIPKQIKADEEFLKNIMKENRDYQTLKLEYSPIEQKCKEIVGNLLYVKIKYLSDFQPRILKTTQRRGVHVHYCSVDIGGKNVQCVVRRIATSIQSDPYLQLSVAEKIK